MLLLLIMGGLCALERHLTQTQLDRMRSLADAKSDAASPFVTLPEVVTAETMLHNGRVQPTCSFLAPNVNILIPTKDPRMLNRCLRSLISTADFNFGTIKFHFGINYNDNNTLGKVRRECEKFQLGAMSCVLHEVYDRNDDVTTIVNFMFASIDEGEYFFRFNDDSEMRTRGWNRLAIEALRKTKPIDVGLAIITDSNNKRIQTHSFVSSVHKQIFSYYFPHHFRNWYEDDWITGVYQNTNLTKNTDITIVHHFVGMRYGVHHAAANILERSIDAGTKKILSYLRRSGQL